MVFSMVFSWCFYCTSYLHQPLPPTQQTPPEANAFVTTAPLPTPESLHTLHTLFPTHAPPDGVDMGAGYGVKGYTAIEYVRFLDEFVIGVAAGDDGQLAQEVFQQVQVCLCVEGVCLCVCLCMVNLLYRHCVWWVMWVE